MHQPIHDRDPMYRYFRMVLYSISFTHKILFVHQLMKIYLILLKLLTNHFLKILIIVEYIKLNLLLQVIFNMGFLIGNNLIANIYQTISISYIQQKILNILNFYLCQPHRYPKPIHV